jgi:transposase
VLAAIEAADEAHRQRTTKIEAHERKRSPDSGRKAIPEHFPRIEIEHDLTPEQKMCTKCSTPHPLTRIGQEIRECYRFEPPKISVEQHVRRPMCARSATKRRSLRPHRPSFCRSRWPVLPCSRTSSNPSLTWGLPIYRVSQDLSRYQMNLGPGTLGTWVNTVGGEKVVPLIKLMGEELLAAAFMHIDETPLNAPSIVMHSHLCQMLCLQAIA